MPFPIPTIPTQQKAWYQNLAAASFRTVPFFVRSGTSEFGRRIALHEYPFRDIPWAEDVGRSSRKFNITGFILGDDVIAQRAQLIEKIETPGPGVLSHPTYGTLTVTVASVQFEESWDSGRAFAFRMTCIESGQQLQPTKQLSTFTQTQNLVGVVYAQLAADYATYAGPYLRLGSSVLAASASSVGNFLAFAPAAVNNAESIFGAAATLVAPNNTSFGRPLGSATQSGFTPNPLTINSAATYQSTAGTAAENQSLAAAAQTALAAAAASSDPTQLPAAAQAWVNAILAANNAPSAAISILTPYLGFTTPAPSTGGGLQTATTTAAQAAGDIMRRSVLAALAQASSLYQPSSYNDAINLLELLTGLLDTEIELAADEGLNGSYMQLRALRAAVALDLSTRGASLAPLITFTSNQSLPAPYWAQRNYRDPSRADQLVSLANPPHPAFMPLSFQALAF